MKNKYWLLLFGGILLLSVLFLFLFSCVQETQLIAEIYQNGALTERVDLTSLATPKELLIASDTAENRILLEADGVRMLSASCPDQLCVHQGKVHNSVYPIVCLPNKVVIQLRGNDPSQPDAIAR